jgi:hypothetical protein
MVIKLKNEARAISFKSNRYEFVVGGNIDDLKLFKIDE